MPISPATRLALLALRRQRGLAQQGRHLLEQKRVALVRELMKMVDVALQHGGELDRAAAVARETLDIAKALDGPEAVRSAAFASAATGARFEVEVEGSTVLGIPVPIITQQPRRRSLLDRGYSLAFSSRRVDRVGDTFEEELRALVRLTEADVRIRRVGEEIQRTARRVNALDYVVIPAMEMEMRRIDGRLEQREREDHFRLKHLKKARSHR